MTKVLARKAIVKTAKDFAITGSAACPGIKFIYIGKAEVESKIKALDELAFTRAGVRYHGIGDESQTSTTAPRPTKVNGWKFTHHGWISNHWLETQPLVGKPTTMWLEF